MEAKRTLANLSLKLRQPPEGVYIMQKAIIVCVWGGGGGGGCCWRRK